MKSPNNFFTRDIISMAAPWWQLLEVARSNVAIVVLLLLFVFDFGNAQKWIHGRQIYRDVNVSVVFLFAIYSDRDQIPGGATLPSSFLFQIWHQIANYLLLLGGVGSQKCLSLFIENNQEEAGLVHHATMLATNF